MKRILLLTFTVLLLILSVPIANLIKDRNTEFQIEQVESAIQRSLNLCYAQEGFYPAQLDYLIKNYGLIVDDRLYFVSYKSFASNIRPDITVFRKGN
ncbi:MAG: hypothetical protein HGA35_05205 [Erysipelotrichaceae bacterium]|nr:hypothetical protein [Erysipelotrichaceae bacterium]